MSRGYRDENGREWKDEAEYKYFRARAPVPPKVEPGSRGDETTETHPAFGQIRASRVSGRAVLFGSDFNHNGFVSVTITRSKQHRTLSRDWTNPVKEVVEVLLSEAQWATFVSTLIYGTGVPCTINHLQGEVIPAIAAPVDRRAQFKAEANAHIEKADAVAKQLLQRAKDGTLKTMRKDELLHLLYDLNNNLSGGVNFVAKSFGEHVEQVMEHAKVETEAYVSGVLQRAGAQALVETGKLPQMLPTEAPVQEEGWQWCFACNSYHHPANPTCKARQP